MRQLIMWLVIEKSDQEKRKKEHTAFSFASYPLQGFLRHIWFLKMV